MKLLLVSLLSIGTVFVLSFRNGNSNWETISPEASLEDVLVKLGDQKQGHAIATADPEKVKKGEQLIKYGFVRNGILKTKLISPYFTCTDCHSLVRETADTKITDPEARLEYAIQQNQPFFPASTFWGIYNRKSWYNGDYDKKYGEIIIKAKKSLPEAVQVCAKYCSAGRFLDDWELDAIMHYYKANELKWKDIQLNEKAKSLLEKTNLSSEDKSELLSAVNQSYVIADEATFLPTMNRENRKYGKEGNAERGRAIFEKSCMHCHYQGRVSHLKLDKDVLTAKMFVGHLEGYDDKTIYQIVRYGTYTRAGRNQYMPLYTKEKMSDNQIEDLVAYIQKLAKN